MKNGRRETPVLIFSRIYSIAGRRGARGVPAVCHAIRRRSRRVVSSGLGQVPATTSVRVRP